ncbi:hypothetical protein ABPG75_011276 [Micractinium tetrahymenae]
MPKVAAPQEAAEAPPPAPVGICVLCGDATAGDEHLSVECSRCGAFDVHTECGINHLQSWVPTVNTNRGALVQVRQRPRLFFANEGVRCPRGSYAAKGAAAAAGACSGTCIGEARPQQAGCYLRSPRHFARFTGASVLPGLPGTEAVKPQKEPPPPLPAIQPARSAPRQPSLQQQAQHAAGGAAGGGRKLGKSGKASAGRPEAFSPRAGYSGEWSGTSFVQSAEQCSDSFTVFQIVLAAPRPAQMASLQEEYGDEDEAAEDEGDYWQVSRRLSPSCTSPAQQEGPAAGPAWPSLSGGPPPDQVKGPPSAAAAARAAPQAAPAWGGGGGGAASGGSGGGVWAGGSGNVLHDLKRTACIQELRSCGCSHAQAIAATDATGCEAELGLQLLLEGQLLEEIADAQEALDRQAAEEAERQRQRELLRQAEQQKWQGHGSGAGPGEHDWAPPAPGEQDWGPAEPVAGEWGALATQQGGRGAPQTVASSSDGGGGAAMRGGWAGHAQPAGRGRGRGGQPGGRNGGRKGRRAEQAAWQAGNGQGVRGHQRGGGGRSGRSAEAYGGHEPGGGWAEPGQELSWDDAPAQQSGSWGGIGAAEDSSWAGGAAPAGGGWGGGTAAKDWGGGAPAKGGDGGHGAAAEDSSWAGEHPGSWGGGASQPSTEWGGLAAAEDLAQSEEAPEQAGSGYSTGAAEQVEADYSEGSADASWGPQPAHEDTGSGSQLAEESGSSGGQLAEQGGRYQSAQPVRGGRAAPSGAAGDAWPTEQPGAWEVEGEEGEEGEQDDYTEEESDVEEEEGEEGRHEDTAPSVQQEDAASYQEDSHSPEATLAAADAADSGPQVVPSPAGASPSADPEAAEHSSGGSGHLPRVAVSSGSFPAPASAGLPSPGSSPRYVPPQRRAVQGPPQLQQPAVPPAPQLALLPGTHATRGMPPPGFQAGAGSSAPLKGVVGSALLPGVQQRPGVPQDPSASSQPPQQAPLAKAVPFGSPVAPPPATLAPLPPHLVAKQAQQVHPGGQAAPSSAHSPAAYQPVAAPAGHYAAPAVGQHASYAVHPPQQAQQAPQYSQPPMQPGYYSPPQQPGTAYYSPQSQAAAFYHPQTQQMGYYQQGGYYQPATHQAAAEWQQQGWPPQQAAGAWVQAAAPPPPGWAAGASPAYQQVPYPHQPEAAVQPPAAGTQWAQCQELQAQQAQQPVVVEFHESHTQAAPPYSRHQQQPDRLRPPAQGRQPRQAAGERRGKAAPAYSPPLHASSPHPGTEGAPASGPPGMPQQPTVVLAQKLSPEVAAMGIVSQAPIPPPPGFAYSQPAPSPAPTPQQHTASAGISSGTHSGLTDSSTSTAAPQPGPSSGSLAGRGSRTQLSAAAPAYTPVGPRTPAAGGPCPGHQAGSGEEEDYLSGLMGAMGVS